MVCIVLRNTTTRKNAAYVVAAYGLADSSNGKSEYWVTGYWGRWDLFEMRGDTTELRRQVKYHGPSRLVLMETVQEIVTEKLCKGYRVQEEYSAFPEWPICEYGQRWQAYQEEPNV